MGLDPALTLFPIANVVDYIKSYKHHEAYIKKSSTLSDTAKHEQFTDNMKWIDWYPTIINFFREIPGRNGLPLSYLCRATNVQAKAAYNNFIDEYAGKAPLVGQAFMTDAAELHTYIVRFTSGNVVAEANMVAHAAENNGFLEFMALKDHYEGVGMQAVNALQADKVLNIFFNLDEKKPHIWWYEFERQLTDAFNTYDHLENRSVH